MCMRVDEQARPCHDRRKDGFLMDKERDFYDAVNERIDGLNKERIHRYLDSCESNPAHCASILTWTATMPTDMQDIIFMNGIKLYSKALKMNEAKPKKIRLFFCLSADITKRVFNNQDDYHPKNSADSMGKKERLIYCNIDKIEDMMKADPRWTWKDIHAKFLLLVQDQLTGHYKLMKNPCGFMSVNYLAQIAGSYLADKDSFKKKDIREAVAKRMADDPLGKGGNPVVEQK